jgi:hypothetical protein
MAFSETFWTCFVTTSSGIVLACLAACYKGKCSKVTFCFRLINSKSETSIEMVEDLKTLNNDLQKIEEGKNIQEN